MVNIPLQTMDDYGVLEPTDVGTMTIDYDSKEDLRKRNRWEYEEVQCMLNLIRENNFVNRYSVIRMATMLSQLMINKGYNRTERQVHLKLTTLRKNYLSCERQKLINGYVKECPFYKELREIYRDINNANGFDSDDYDLSSQDECLVKFPNDTIDWTKGEVQKMLNVIKSMKLKNELTLTFFSPIAVRMIAEAMQNAGYDRSTEQVKNALINLRTTYIDYKIGFDNNENPSECIFYPCLELFWGREYKKCRLKDKRKIKPDDPWTTEETIILLTLIQDLSISEDAYKNTDKAAETLRQSLTENGYCRSKQQILNRLEQLKSDFSSVHNSYSEIEAVQKFPFYNLYKKLFEEQFERESINQSDHTTNLQKDSIEYAEFCENLKNTPQKNIKGAIWSKEEVRLLLKTIRELTKSSQTNVSLEDEKLQKLINVLSEAGFHKTAEQIKYQLVLLKESYLKCNLEDSSEKDIFECPFYNELHDIFHTPVSDERYEFIQNLLAENMDLSISKFSDHSYTNVKFGNSSTESRTNDKVTVVPNKSLDTWFPVESIIDDDAVTDSSTLDFSNLTAVSSKEQEKSIGDAFLASLPNNSNNKIEGNRSILEDNIVIPEERVPPVVNDVVIDQEITTTTEEVDVDYSTIYRYEPENFLSSNKTSATTTMTRCSTLSGDDDGQPPNKRPRVVEDEKIVGKNKFLLRPVDMNPSSLNVTNMKFVRLIVANDSNKNQVHSNHITAHIEPMNSANSVSSGMSSPVERADILKLATERIFTKEDLDKIESVKETKTDFQCNGTESSNNTVKNKITETIMEALHTMMKHDELMQQKHHSWLEKQFEIQRRHNENQNRLLMNEFKDLRNIVTVLLENKQSHANNQSR